MYYIKKISISSVDKNEEAVVSNIIMKPGLNIIYGPSNTGKSLVLDCIDYMLGGEPRRLSNHALRIKAVGMFLDVDGNEVYLSRKLYENPNDIIVTSDSPGINGGTYTVNGRTKDKETISSLWLKLMGIDQDVKIIKQIEDSVTQTLTVRTFFHFYVIDENRISGENSILKSGGQKYTQNIPVPTITSLIYMMTEANYIFPEDKKKVRAATHKVRESAAREIVYGTMNAVREEEQQEAGIEDTQTVEEIQTEIDNILGEISAAEDSLSKTTEHYQEISKALIEISGSLAESKVLRNRYDSLRSQYESDMRRLTFIAEADIHSSSIPRLERCPFCNGDLPKEERQSCLEAAIAEADKIELHIKDLQAADEALAHEMDLLESKRARLVREQQSVQASIRGELRPQIKALREKLGTYTAALERAKAKKMVKSFTRILNEQLFKIETEDSANDFDVREKIKSKMKEPLDRLLQTILEQCHYEKYEGAFFDIDTCDVNTYGSNKLSQGQGFRAFLNSVMALAVQEMLNEVGLHQPHLLVLDSPILSLKERGEETGTEITSESMRGGLFKYMVEHEENRQTIILENDIPAIDYSPANLIHFTRNPNEGRYGLILGYQE